MATIGQRRHGAREWKALALLHGVVGVAAVAGGIGLAGGGAGLPERFLEGTIFSSYVVPGSRWERSSEAPRCWLRSRSGGIRTGR